MPKSGAECDPPLRLNVVPIVRRKKEVSGDTVDTLEAVLAAAKAGEVTGLAMIVLSGCEYQLVLRGAGADKGNQMVVSGLLAALQRMALDLN